MKRFSRRILLILAAVILPTAAAAQVVLKGSDLTESALVDALTPRAGTRNLARDPQRPVAPRSAAASILITFKTNSTELTSQAKDQLDIVGRALRSDRLAEFSFMLEGHADPRGTAELNQWLSEGRARSVRQYLVENHKVDQARLRAIGKGDREPLNRSDPAAAENRRVTIVTMTN
jgi:outer membrane protein OmpA-like peptidoglycan-associated protein